MKITLTAKASQQLALTPQLQQAIRLLALSNIELRQELEQATLDNPLLELEEHPEEDQPAPSQPASPEQALSSDDLGHEPDTPLEMPLMTEAFDRMDSEALGGTDPETPEPAASQDSDAPSDSPEDWLADHDSLSEWGSGSGTGDEDDSPSGQEPVVEGLLNHLRGQIVGLKLSARDRAWLEILMSSLDDDGFLRESLEELAENFATVFEERLGGELEPEELMVGLRQLQSLDPLGVGARDLPECLLLQLDALTSTADPDARVTLEAAKILVRHHLEQVGGQPPASLAKVCGLERGLVQSAIDLIRSLEPRPARRFSGPAAQTLIPDVIVSRDRSGQWVARLSAQALPRLNINPVYARIIRDGGGEGQLSQKLQEARWMVKNIEQRSDTILRVSQAIVAAQQTFFEQGPRAMRPMILRDIAEVCELHESTVSRVTTQKYMLTPRGCYELKFFFSSHVGTDDGGAASATALKAQISDWLREEDPRKPLSDQALADRFGSEGVVIARRTVAKYREALRIPSASLRKRT